MATWTNCAGLTRRDCLRLGLGTLFGGGLAHALVGSALIVGLATVCAVPLGILAAVFLAAVAVPLLRLA